MTATERLRALLDERGVEYRNDNGIFTWYVNGVMYNAWAFDNERLTMSVCHLTPERAVEATLGRGTCGNVSDFPKYEFVCSECGGRLDILDEFDNPTVQHNDGSFGPRFCPSCGREVVE